MYIAEILSWDYIFSIIENFHQITFFCPFTIFFLIWALWCLVYYCCFVKHDGHPNGRWKGMARWASPPPVSISPAPQLGSKNESESNWGMSEGTGLIPTACIPPLVTYLSLETWMGQLCEQPSQLPATVALSKETERQCQWFGETALVHLCPPLLYGTETFCGS